MTTLFDLPPIARLIFAARAYNRGVSENARVDRQMEEAELFNARMRELERRRMAPVIDSLRHTRVPIIIGPGSSLSDIPLGMDEGMVRMASALQKTAAMMSEQDVTLLKEAKGELLSGITTAAKKGADRILGALRGVPGVATTASKTKVPSIGIPSPTSGVSGAVRLPGTSVQTLRSEQLPQSVIPRTEIGSGRLPPFSTGPATRPAAPLSSALRSQQADAATAPKVSPAATSVAAPAPPAVRAPPPPPPPAPRSASPTLISPGVQPPPSAAVVAVTPGATPIRPEGPTTGGTATASVPAPPAEATPTQQRGVGPSPVVSSGPASVGPASVGYDAAVSMSVPAPSGGRKIVGDLAPSSAPRTMVSPGVAPPPASSPGPAGPVTSGAVPTKQPSITPPPAQGFAQAQHSPVSRYQAMPAVPSGFLGDRRPFPTAQRQVPSSTGPTTIRQGALPEHFLPSPPTQVAEAGVVSPPSVRAPTQDEISAATHEGRAVAQQHAADIAAEKERNKPWLSPSTKMLLGGAGVLGTAAFLGDKAIGATERVLTSGEQGPEAWGTPYGKPPVAVNPYGYPSY